MFSYCHSLSDVDSAYCVSYRRFLGKKDLAELRLDLLDFDEDTVKDYFHQTNGLPSVATFRLTEEEDEEYAAEELARAVRMLSAAVMAGAAYIDIDLEFPEAERDWLITLALNYHCGIIVSYHNYYGVGALRLFSAGEAGGLRYGQLRQAVEGAGDGPRLPSVLCVAAPEPPGVRRPADCI